MIKGLMLLMLAALLFQACADTNSTPETAIHNRRGQHLCDLRGLRPG